MSKKGKMIRKLAYDDVYKLKGQPYTDQQNPFRDGSEFDLYKRCYQKVYDMFWRLEGRCQEMFEVYGGPYND